MEGLTEELALSDIDALGLRLGLIDGETDGLTLGLTEGEALAEIEALGDRLGLTLGLKEGL